MNYSFISEMKITLILSKRFVEEESYLSVYRTKKEFVRRKKPRRQIGKGGGGNIGACKANSGTSYEPAMECRSSAYDRVARPDAYLSRKKTRGPSDLLSSAVPGPSRALGPTITPLSPIYGPARLDIRYFADIRTDFLGRENSSLRAVYRTDKTRGGPYLFRFTRHKILYLSR